MRRFVLPLLLLVAFLVLGLAVRAEPPPEIDQSTSAALRAAFGGPTHDALLFTTYALYTPWSWIATAVLAAVAGLLRGRRAAVVVLVCTVVTLLAVRGGKLAYGRLRPPEPAVEGAVRSTTSYPSGHVAWTVAALGSLAWVVTRRRRTRAAALAAVAVAVVWVALSRIHLGRHYLTDCVGAVLLAVSVCGFVVVWLGGSRAHPP